MEANARSPAVCVNRTGNTPKREIENEKTVTLALTLLLLTGSLTGCADDTPADNAENTAAADTAQTQSLLGTSQMK